MRNCWPLLLVLLVGCGQSQNEGKPEMTVGNAVLELEVGKSIDGLLENSPLKFSEECLPAASVCWYKIKYRSADPSLPTVIINQGGSPLTITKVTDVSVVRAKKEETISDFSVTLLGLPDNTDHEENRKLVYKLLSDFSAAGWKKYFYPSDPRISGTELGKIPPGNRVFGESPLSKPMFDPNVELSLDRWVAVKTFYDWYLYSGNTFAHVMVQRRDSDTSPESKGTYLISIDFTAQETTWALNFEEDDRPNWKSLFPARLKELRLRRDVAEKFARDAGVAIEENYEAPKMELMK